MKEFIFFANHWNIILFYAKLAIFFIVYQTLVLTVFDLDTMLNAMDTVKYVEIT